jgi:hypothetical protein
MVSLAVALKDLTCQMPAGMEPFRELFSSDLQMTIILQELKIGEKHKP